MLGVALAIVVATAAGVLAERRLGERAQRMAHVALDLLIRFLLPFVTFFLLVRLELSVGLGAGLGLAYLGLAVVGLAAYGVGSRVLGLSRAATGALVCAVVMANTGYLGLPLAQALLDRGGLAAAVAFDSLVSGPMFYVAGFAVGAAFGTRAGAGLRARLRAFLRNPPLWAAVAGLLAPDVLAPDVLVDAARLAVPAMLPIGFFVLGVTLAAEAEAGALAFPPAMTRPVAAAISLRMLAAPALLAAASAVIVELPDAYLLQAAMPSGINALVVGHAYGLDLRIASASIAWTTALAVAAGLLTLVL